MLGAVLQIEVETGEDKTLAKAHNGTVYGQLRMGCGSLRQGWEGGLGTD